MKLTEIARKTLKSCFKNKIFEPDEKTKKKYFHNKACFISLHKDTGDLRGCIGCIYSEHELWKSVQENTIKAAFEDPRFNPVNENELRHIKIEVSVLSVPEKIIFNNTGELLNKIDKDMGIILKKDIFSATFLPQVWNQIPEKINFLEFLSEKAGLDKDAWKNPETELWFYRVKVEKE